MGGGSSAYGQLPMSLSDDATTTFAVTRPSTLAVTCTALTVRPSSGVLNGICSLSTSFTTPTLTVVFGAMAVGWAITTVAPTLR